MQEPLKRLEPGELFLVLEGLFLDFAESLGVMPIHINRAGQPQQGVRTEEDKHANNQRGHKQEHPVE